MFNMFNVFKLIPDSSFITGGIVSCVTLVANLSVNFIEAKRNGDRITSQKVVNSMADATMSGFIVAGADALYNVLPRKYKPLANILLVAMAICEVNEAIKAYKKERQYNLVMAEHNDLFNNLCEMVDNLKNKLDTQEKEIAKLEKSSV